MKNFFLSLTILISCMALGQSDLYFGKKPSVKAELLLENGETKTGYLQGVQPKRFISAITSVSGNNDLKLDYDKGYKFKENQNSPVQNIIISDIKKITILESDDSERLAYAKIKLKTINSKYEVVDLNKTAILPLIQEGKLSLYGYTIIFFMSNSQSPNPKTAKYSSTLFVPYLKNVNSDYAYMPFDISRMNFFNLGKLGGKFKKALEESTNDCPEFQENIDEIMKVFEKRLTKEDKQMYYDKEEKKKQIRKDVKDKDMENFLQMKVDYEYAIQPYIKLVNDYNMKCSKK